MVNWQQIISRIAFFIVSISLEIWIFFEALRLYFAATTSSYTIDQLFWLLTLVILAPVLPQITFYTGNIISVVFLHIAFVMSVGSLILLDQAFIPALPTPEVFGILVYSYVTIGINYLVHRDTITERTRVEIGYTVFRLLSFFAGIFFGLVFGNQESFSANYLLYVLITIPLFLWFAILIFTNLELKTKDVVLTK